MTKIIHCADLHLDSPMETHMTEEQASIRNTEIIHTFLRLTEYAAKNDVRAVIIAGDMFDSERIKIRTVDEILDAIRRTPNVDYLYLAGRKRTEIYWGVGTKAFAVFEGIPQECISGSVYEWQAEQLSGRYRRTGTEAI